MITIINVAQASSMCLFALFATAIMAITSAFGTPVSLASVYRPSPIRMHPVLGNSSPSAKTVAVWADPSHGTDPSMIATLIVAASVPSINIDNIRGFVKIECSNKTAKAKFASSTNISQWPEGPVLMLIDGRHMCGLEIAHHLAMVLATSWSIEPDQQTVIFQLADPEASGVRGSFKLGAIPVANQKANPLNSNSLANLALSSDVSSVFSITIPIDFEQTITKSIEFPIPMTPLVINGQCNSCGISGTTSVSIAAEGSLFPVSVSFSTQWTGSLQADIDISIVIATNSSVAMQSSSVKLFEIPFSPISIPGLIEVGPLFRVNGQTSIGITGTAQADLRLGMSVPDFNATLSFNGGASATGFQPTVSSHLNLSTFATGDIDFALIPELTIGATIIGYDLGEGAAVAQISFIESNKVNVTDTTGVCLSAYLSSLFDTNVLSMTSSMSLFQPYQLYEKCF